MERSWRIARGERIYAIGDIHGRADLFADLLTRIRQDNAQRPDGRTRIVVLGDGVDRGPDSAALVTRLMRYTQANRRFIVLKGNHEQIMLAALAGDLTAAQAWLDYGGVATLRSWGVPERVLSDAALPVLMWEARRLVTPQVRSWIARLKLYVRSGNVLFVHAGIRPGVPLRKQDALDLMWIRQEFLGDDRPRSFLVVHGHSIFEQGPDVGAYRIGIDTGAYRTGRLTALGLEAGDPWSLDSEEGGPTDRSGDDVSGLMEPEASRDAYRLYGSN